MKKHTTGISASHTEGAAMSAAARPRRRWGPVRVIGIVILSIAVLIVLLLCALSIYLTPARLADIINREGSQYLNADIHARNVSYTLWRSFPRLRVTTDSITVRSRTLDSIPEDIRRQLPADADRLGSLRSFAGSINVVDLLLNRYVLQDVQVDGLHINLVAYNDSINNYAILPHTGQKLRRVPYFRVHEVALNNPGAISYRSVATDTRASLSLSSLVLDNVPSRRHGLVTHHDANDYRLSLAGRVSAGSAGLSVLTDFPFSLDGDLTLRFDPFGVALSDYAIDLGEIHSRLSMSVGMGDDPRIESFDYRISAVNLMNLLGYIPREYLPSLQGIKADLPVSASARLLDSWSFSSETLPSIEVDFHVPQGTVEYTVSSSHLPGSGLRTYSLAHSPLEGVFVFDGQRPDSSYLDIPSFTISAPGVEARIGGRVSRLTADPLICATVGVDADLARAMRLIPGASRGMRLSGRLTSLNTLSCNLSEFSRAALEQGVLHIRGGGRADLYGVTLTLPSDSVTLRVGHLAARMQESATALTPTSLDNPASRVKIIIDRAEALTTVGRFATRGLILTADAASRADLTPERIREGFPLSLSLQIDTAAYAAPNGTAVEAERLKFSDVAATTAPGTLHRLLSDGLSLQSDTVRISSGHHAFRLHHPRLSVSVAERQHISVDSIRTLLATVASDTMAVHPRSAAESETSLAGVAPSEMASHTPELLRLNLPAGLADIFRDFSFRTDLRVSRCDLYGPSFDTTDYLGNIDISLDEEALTMRDLEISLSGTPARINGSIDRLREFLTLPASEENPIVADLEVTVPRIDINSLTHSYVEKAGGEAAVRRRPVASPTDTVAMLIPRNISARLTARVGEADYTNLDLSDIVAELQVDSGRLDISRLGIGSSFGRAEAAFAYDTSDIQSMSVSGDIHFNRIDIVRFFDKFHSLLKMMPEMKNLSGYISINGTLGCGIFPSMYLNIPSAHADVMVEGLDLKVHQSPFIRRITRMMLIRTDEDLHIKDMEVHAAVHDNLLQIYPFDFEFDRYRLHMLGVNNFAGRLYYHIAVEKSPVPFPFAINIEGMFHDPKLRFGSEHFDIKHGEEVTSHINVAESVNMMHMLRGLLRELICTGARYRTASPDEAANHFNKIQPD